MRDHNGRTPFQSSPHRLPNLLASVSIRQRQHTPAYVSIRQHTQPISIRQHTPASAYASLRQHTPAYVSIRQHTLGDSATCASEPLWERDY